MDLWVLGSGGGAVIAAARGPTWGLRGKGVVVLRRSICWGRVGRGDGQGVGGGGVVEVGVWASRRERKLLGLRSVEVRATGKDKGHENAPSPGNNDPSIPEGDGSGGSNSVSGETKSEDSLTQKPPHSNLDWRTFRANLVAQEKGQTRVSDMSSVEPAPEKPSSKLGSRWAHPIPVPETGCILIATDKLDGLCNFERTVILLLRIGTRENREGPFGVILNRPLHKRLKHMKPTNADLATTFADCSLHLGGPQDASIFLVRTSEDSPTSCLEQVVPSICVGGQNSLHEAARLVKKGACEPKDFRFFVGYAGWELDQLREEIEAGFWAVAACSSDLISSAALDSSSGLWEEILQLMGGRYADMSRKPKDDDKS